MPVVAGPEANTIRCQDCGLFVTLALPLKLDISVKILKAFADLHQFCGQQQVFAVADNVLPPADEEPAQ